MIRQVEVYAIERRIHLQCDTAAVGGIGFRYRVLALPRHGLKMSLRTETLERREQHSALGQHLWPRGTHRAEVECEAKMQQVRIRSLTCFDGA